MTKVSFDSIKGLTEKNGGLSEDEVSFQRSRYGKNEIVEVTENFWLRLTTDTLKDPMIWFLLGIGTIFIIVGETKEALVLFIAVLPLVFMDAFLHWRTQASTTALRGQLSTYSRVIRNSIEKTINSSDIVPGDLVVLSPTHQFLPADGIFEKTETLQIDESMLTGEAFPIQKHATLLNPYLASSKGDALIDNSELGFAGTRVLTGKGYLRVLFTGKHTAYGEIVQSVSKITNERTPLQASITKLVQGLIFVAGFFCLILASIRYYQGHGWLDALLSAATLAVAAIPEEFPVVFTFYLGVGVYRLAKRHALVRRAVSVENIGRITRICTDKTGTLTIGQLKLTHIDYNVGATESEVLKCALAASDPNGIDPVDLAIRDYSKNKGLIAPTRSQVFPFTEDRKREVAVAKDGEKNFFFMKGAPETVLEKSIISEQERQIWEMKISEWAESGHKVLACAYKDASNNNFTENIEPESGFQFCGLLAFEDPPRPEIASSLNYCKRNGIEVLMVTGDHPETATAIAKDIHLGTEVPKVISAESEPEKFEEKWLKENPYFLHEVDVVARCTPLQKFQIVKALRHYGELVAVTGDGVNDVPALKAADIGIAMGIRGTTSAKEVSSIILTDDNFSTIVNAIMEGRQLFSNLKKSFEYLLLFHIPFVLTAALIPLLDYPLLYLPIHIVWLELIIHPTALFAFQQNATNRIDGAPRRETYFFTVSDTIRLLTVGLGLTAAIVWSYTFGLHENAETGHARAVVMTLLSLWSSGLVLVLTKGNSWTSKFLIGCTVASAVLLIQIPLLAKVLHLTPIHLIDWLKVSGIVIIFLLLDSGLKKVSKALSKSQQ